MRRRLAGPGLPAVIGVLCYLNSLGGDFVYDDKFIVRDNPLVRRLDDQRSIWLSDWWKSGPDQGEGRDRLYRPLTLLTFAIDYQLQQPQADGTPTPFGFHLTNVLLHGLACGLVWYFLRELFGAREAGGELAAGAGAMLFAVHPVHCEAVAGIVGRAEILATIFLLGGLLALGSAARSSVRRTIVAAALFLAALLSKETAICYLPVALAWLWRDGVKQPRRWWLGRAAVLAAPLLIYLPLRYVALDHHLVRAAPVGILLNPVIVAEGVDRFTAPLTIIGMYARLILFPLRLSCVYGIGVLDVERVDGDTLLGALVGCAAIAVLVPGVRRGGDWRAAAALVAMLAASYLLISNTVLLIGVAAAERLMYWPSVLAIALLVYCGRIALERVGGRRRTIAGEAARTLQIVGGRPAWSQRLVGHGFVGGLVILLAARTYARNADWRTELDLFEADLANYPRCPALSAGLASAHVLRADQESDVVARRGGLRRADRLLERSLRHFPVHGYALHLRAQVRYRLLDPRGARELLIECLKLQIPPTDARGFLARLDAATVSDDARQADLLREIELYPTDPTPRERLGELLLDAGRPAEAALRLREAAKLDPESYETCYLLGVSLAQSGDADGATAAFREGVRLDPENSAMLVNLAIALAPRDLTAAIAAARAAVRAAPRDIGANEALASLLLAHGDRVEAAGVYRRVLGLLAPDDSRRAEVEAQLRQVESGR